MNNRETVQTFLNNEPIAIAGVSRNPKKFGSAVFTALLKNGFNVIPVNPNKGEIEGVPFINSLSDLAPSIQKLLIVTKKSDTYKVLEEAISKGIKNIWIQNGCETVDAINLANTNNVNLISKTCILMYANPKGIHKFHSVIAKLFGGQLK